MRRLIIFLTGLGLAMFGILAPAQASDSRYTETHCYKNHTNFSIPIKGCVRIGWRPTANGLRVEDAWTWTHTKYDCARIRMKNHPLYLDANWWVGGRGMVEGNGYGKTAHCGHHWNLEIRAGRKAHVNTLVEWNLPGARNWHMDKSFWVCKRNGC